MSWRAAFPMMRDKGDTDDGTNWQTDVPHCTKCTFVWRDFLLIFRTARQLQEILNQIQRDERLTEHQPKDRRHTVSLSDYRKLCPVTPWIMVISELTLYHPLPRPCAGFRRGATSFPSAPGSRRRPRWQTLCASRGWGRDFLVRSQWVAPLQHTK